MLFKMIFFLDSCSRRSLKFVCWYGLSDTFTKTWSGGLSSVFIVSSLPAIVVDGSKSLSFPDRSLVRIVSSTTPDSASLVHGSTHDKSVPYLFSTPQTRCQQQTEILIYLLKKLAPVNDIWYFLYEYGKNFSFRVAANAPTKYQSNSTSGRGARASYRTMLPKISARRSLLEPSFRYLSPGIEGEKCRPLDHTWQIPFGHSARL